MRYVFAVALFAATLFVPDDQTLLAMGLVVATVALGACEPRVPYRFRRSINHAKASGKPEQNLIHS